MPRTGHPLDYPICRIFLRVGIALHSWMSVYPIPREQRKAWEVEVAAFLELPQAVEAGILTSYRIYYDQDGYPDDFRLVPHPRYRNTPGLPRLRQLFFKRRFGTPNPSPKQRANLCPPTIPPWRLKQMGLTYEEYLEKFPRT